MAANRGPLDRSLADHAAPADASEGVVTVIALPPCVQAAVAVLEYLR